MSLLVRVLTQILLYLPLMLLLLLLLLKYELTHFAHSLVSSGRQWQFNDARMLPTKHFKGIIIEHLNKLILKEKVAGKKKCRIKCCNMLR